MTYERLIAYEPVPTHTTYVNRFKGREDDGSGISTFFPNFRVVTRTEPSTPKKTLDEMFLE